MIPTLDLLVCSLLLFSTAVEAQPLVLPENQGNALTLTTNDLRLPLQQTQKWDFTAGPAAGQVVLNFRVRVDYPAKADSSTVFGESLGMLKVELNGEIVGIRSPRRQMRLLNKAGKITATTTCLRNGSWRLVYAPDFEASDGEESDHFALDVSDLIKSGENVLMLTNTGKPWMTKRSGRDLTLVFRDLRLEIKPSKGILPGEPQKTCLPRPFVCGKKRSGALQAHWLGDRGIKLVTASHAYELRSRFSCAGDDVKIQWIDFANSPQPAEGKLGKGEILFLQTPQWTLERRLKMDPVNDKLFINDTFRNRTDKPVGIRMEHALKLAEGNCGRVYFGGVEEPNVNEVIKPDAPYLFLARETEGIGIAANDDVLRTQSALYYDDEIQTGGLRNDWFGLQANDSYTMSWTVYATATDNVFDLVNLIRHDWDVSFPIMGGYTFFEPDRILEYDDAKLKQYLDMLNINVAMSQGGWVDFKLQEKTGAKNLGFGPAVAGGFYADYRKRLKAACEKLRRLRPGIKCLIYYDIWIAAGLESIDKYADSQTRLPDGSPRLCYRDTKVVDYPMTYITPTLTNTYGKETLEKIPPMILDEIGGDGLYWDEMHKIFGEWGSCYAYPDGYTYLIDPETGGINRALGALDLTSLPFKLAFMKVFLDRRKMIVGNGAPTTLTEGKRHFTRFTETDVPYHPPTTESVWLFTPVCYAGWSTYKKKGVTEKDFLEDIKRKIWKANLYLYSAPMFYHLFTHENIATYEYPITVQELDEGVIVGQERIITLRPGRFGWAGKKWKAEVLLFNPEQILVERKALNPEADGFATLELPADWGAVIVKK